MRSVRTLAGCLIAALVTAAAAATPALAEPQPTGKWAVYKDCPYNNPEVLQGEQQGTNCVVGLTKGGAQGGQFTVGSVTTPLYKKITLRGGVIWKENPETGIDEGRLVPPTSGPTLEAPPLTVPKGLYRVTEQIEEEAGWPTQLKEAFLEAKHHHEMGLKATIELAGGNRVYEETNAINSQNLINQEGVAIELPLKVKLSGPLLSRLQDGHETCYIGSDANPVVQHLTSGTSEAPPPYEANSQVGSPGQIKTYEGFGSIALKGSMLVDSTWPVVTEAEGCGGTYEQYIDKAISLLLGLPAPAGASVTVLSGTLYTGNACWVKRNAETGWTWTSEHQTVVRWEGELRKGKITTAELTQKKKEAEYEPYAPGEYEGKACTQSPET